MSSIRDFGGKGDGTTDDTDALRHAIEEGDGHVIHLTTRNRNVIIADCHVYDCRGVGIFLDRVNLHQINIHGNHVSYCKRGGIVVANSEVRNIQICSNDIEYNFDLNENESADI